MKGLLLKDFYLIKNYCRMYILIIAIAVIASLFTEGVSGFLMVYPAMLAASLPVTVLSYEEFDKWNIFSQTFPMSRKDMVTEKYILTSIIVVAVIVCTSAVMLTKMFVSKTDSSELLTVISVQILISFLSPSIGLPLMFKFGTEKGRRAYIVAIGCLFGGLLGLIMICGIPTVKSAVLDILLPAAGIIMFVFSWMLSIKFYEAREL